MARPLGRQVLRSPHPTRPQQLWDPDLDPGQGVPSATARRKRPELNTHRHQAAPVSLGRRESHVVNVPLHGVAGAPGLAVGSP